MSDSPVIQEVLELRRQVETLTKERDGQKALAQGYYGEASKGWSKFREAERQLADRDARIAALEQDLYNMKAVTFVYPPIKVEAKEPT